MSVLKLECIPSNRYALVEGTSSIKVLVKVRSEGEGGGARLPLNVALTLDRSTSMYEDNKLDYVKAAACEMIDELGEADTLALVDFGSDVNVSIGATPVKDKEKLKETVRGLRAKGATNLYDALKAGANEVRKNLAPSQVSRILLLTDGEATEGVTEDDVIAQAAEDLWGSSISVTTLGVGRDYPEEFLAAVASAAGGNHYYISSKEDCDRIFREELASLSSIVAKEVSLTVTTPEGVASRVVNKGYKSEASDGSLKIRLDDLEGGKTVEVVFDLRTGGRPKGEFLLATVDLAYDDTAGGTGRGSAKEEIAVQFTAQPAEVRGGINKDVLRVWEEVEAWERTEEIVGAVKDGKKDAEAAAGELKDLVKTLMDKKSKKAGDIKAIATTILDKGGVDEHLGKTVVMEARKAHKAAKDTLS